MVKDVSIHAERLGSSPIPAPSSNHPDLSYYFVSKNKTLDEDGPSLVYDNNYGVQL